MTGAATATGRCAHCGCPAPTRADDGVWWCSIEHLLLARIHGSRSAAPPRALGRSGPEPLGRTRGEQVHRVRAARDARHPDEAIRLARTLCEDADELLCQAAEAARGADVKAALEPLAEVRVLAISILHALHRPVPAGPDPVPLPGPLDEDEVLRALAVVQELDSQLRDARIGYRGAGWRAGELAEKLILAVDRLGAQAASGRTRPRVG